jgi:hypothetical protein
VSAAVLGRRLFAATCALALLGPTGSAWAEHGDGEVSDAAPIVAAGPRGEEEIGERLLLRAHRRQLCLTVADDPRGDESTGSSSCSELPRADYATPFIADLVEPEASEGVRDEPFARSAQVEQAENRVAAGAVRGSVYFVEYELSEGRRIRIPTVDPPPELAGRPAGELRYFLGALPPRGRIYGRRFLDVFGGILGEEDEDAFEPGGGRPPLHGPVSLAHVRAGNSLFALSASVESRLDPVRGDVTRRRPVLCLRTRTYEYRGDSTSGTGGSRCHPMPLEDAAYDVSSSCGTRPRNIVHGVGPAGQVPRRALLGDGSTIPIRRIGLPATFGAGDAVAFAATAPAGAAVRALIFPDGERADVAQAPPALVDCGMFRIFFDDFEPGGPGPGGDVDVAAPGAPPLNVRDEGEKLCVAVGRPTRALECAEPGPWLSSALANTSADRRLAGGAVDPRVTALRVRLDDDTRFDVATHRGEPYAGRWAGQLAFFSVAAPPGRRISQVDLLDERGRRLWPIIATAPRLARDARPLLRARGARGPFMIAAAPLEPYEHFEASCVFITRGYLPRAGRACDYDTLPDPFWLQADVSCRLRAAVVLLGLPRNARAVARLRGGTRVPLTVRRGPSGERVGILVVPPRRWLRSIAVRRRSGALRERFRLPLPPATRQCGYTFFKVGEGAR